MSITATIPPLLAGSGLNVTPNTTGLPGITELDNIVGALMTIGVVASLAGLIISAIVWAVGHHSSNPQHVSRGKAGVIVAVIAAALCGGAELLINFFFHAGSLL